MLKNNPSLRIIGEAVHRSRFCLVSSCDHIEKVRKVIGRADTLRLCGEWLRSTCVGSVEFVETAYDVDEPARLFTPAVAMSAAERDTTAFLCEAHQEATTSVASLQLRVLVSAPEELVETSRCVVLSHGRQAEQTAPSGSDKSVLYLCLDKSAAGSLASALNVLQRHGVNLLSIRSFPDLHEPSKVDFILEAQG